MSRAFYLTTPLYYVNDVPHVGHTYTTVIGDAIARYKRLCGLEVCFLTGTDEHGLKIERTAQQREITPNQLTDENSRVFAEVWDRMGIHYDEFIRTTQKRHYATVSENFERMKKNGHIYLGEYSGLYCVRCESYVSGQQTNCPECGSPTEFIKEESYFFKLSAFADKLLTFYRDNPDFVIPQTRLNEIISFVRGGLKDISISRTSFQWGIPVPNEDRHIFYVWFDALHGYLSGIGFDSDKKRFRQTWPAAIQLMGKDILRFHGVYWPAFLMAAGLEPPRHLLVHGWWTINGEKMSKSLGNFVRADTLIRALPRDYIRYFLLREIPLGSDGNFSFDALVTRVNSDLANDLGNLASRVLKMIQNYFDGKIPESAGLEGSDEELVRYCRETVKLYRENFDKLQITKALDNTWELIAVCNKYLVAHEPWKMAQDPAKRPRLGTVLFNAAEALRIIAVILSPVLPDGSRAILEQMKAVSGGKTWSPESLSWGGLKAGSQLGKIEPVYPRLDRKKFLASMSDTPGVQQAAKTDATGSDPAPDIDKISIADFAKVEMRVGRILEAQRIPNSSKLLKLKVDIGTEVRQLVAGIGKAYAPETLPGRVVAVVTNLEPAKLMGVESNGMIVAASIEGRSVLTTFAEQVEIGARLK